MSGYSTFCGSFGCFVEKEKMKMCVCGLWCLCVCCNQLMFCVILMKKKKNLLHDCVFKKMLCNENSLSLSFMQVYTSWQQVISNSRSSPQGLS
jgi:hypothetical protein